MSLGFTKVPTRQVMEICDHSVCLSLNAFRAMTHIGQDTLKTLKLVF
jgi:hypothetical protein